MRWLLISSLVLSLLGCATVTDEDITILTYVNDLPGYDGVHYLSYQPAGSDEEWVDNLLDGKPPLEYRESLSVEIEPGVYDLLAFADSDGFARYDIDIFDDYVWEISEDDSP